MPAGVNALGENAFRETGLVEIDLPETIREFGKSSFWGCHSLADVYMRHKEAPSMVSWSVFYIEGDCVIRTLHLYPGSKEKYETYPYTKNWIVYFDNIVEDLVTSGINSATLDNETIKSALYDLNGRRIPNVPSKGIYIQNGKKMIRK